MKNLPYPDFENPPVVEVALAVQFERMAGFRYVHQGLLWQRFADTFPHVEDHAALEQLVETFGVPEGRRLAVQLISGNVAPAVRSWLLNETRTELLQIQPDKLVHNWRKIGPGVDEASQYPRYEHIRQQFGDELKIFCAFVEDFDLGDFAPNQCEITYINHIVAGDGWDHHNQIGNISSFLKEDRRTISGLEMENLKVDSRYIIRDAEQNPIGRLHISLQPAFRKVDEKPMFILTLVARGKPDESSSEGVMRFLDHGRSLIVHGFVDVTTSGMHAVWGRKS